MALRAAWTAEQQGPVEAPTYEQAFSAWYDRERDQRITWLAEIGARPVGMLPSPRSVPLYERAGFRAATDLLVRPGR